MSFNASRKSKIKILSDRQADREKSLCLKIKRTKQLMAKPIRAVPTKPTAIHTAPKLTPIQAEQVPPPTIISRTRESLISLFDDNAELSIPSSALFDLADLYLHAAEHRSRHIALIWPASLKTLALVHALATVARWHEGNKQGIRGLFFPVKTNTFSPLNHIHFDRQAILRIAEKLGEFVQGPPNHQVTKSFHQKDAFFFSLKGLPELAGETFNPTIGELLPHFLATSGFEAWKSCDKHLLAIVRAKLLRRAHAKALKINCVDIGTPQTAPDALFALDGKMEDDDLRRACRDLNKGNPPEVVIIKAMRRIRYENPSWKGQLARFCLILEDIFHDSPPGIIVVTDEPYAAFKLKNKLRMRNKKREATYHRQNPHEFHIHGIPSTVGAKGLLAFGSHEVTHPLPREFDVHIVDADVAKVTNRLSRIANKAPGGREKALPLIEAANYLGRMAALPCGVRHMAEHLAGPDISTHTRTTFDWLTHRAKVQDYEQNVGVGNERTTLNECLEEASKLYVDYYEATPFAHKLASIVADAVSSKKGRIALVFTNALYSLLAERFLKGYSQYPNNIQFDSFDGRVYFLSAAHLEEHLNGLDGAKLVFAGLNEESLRLLLSDNRIPAHSVILLTQRAAQFLRASFKPIIENFDEFRSYKPRIESILRKMKELPENTHMQSGNDYALPAFRIELSSEISPDGNALPSDAWSICLENNRTLYKRETSEVYVYDPASENASDAGFRACQVRSLEPGSKLFIMSAELREMVEQVLRDAGVSIQSDKTFEAALRSYHEQVQQKFARRFPDSTMQDKVRAMRKEMLAHDVRLETTLVKEQAMRHWIELGNSSNTPFEQLRPQAPALEPTFKAFAHVLDFSPLEAAYYWQRVIMPIRNSRRLDGRHISDIYAHMLLQPESVMVKANIKRKTLESLFDKARSNVETIMHVIPYSESQQ